MSNLTSQAVLTSLLYIIHQTVQKIEAEYPGAVCVQASNNGALSPIPSSYRIWFSLPGGKSLTIDATQNTQTGQVSWNDQTLHNQPIVGVGGNLMQCVVDIYPAYKAIRNAGYDAPVFFCGLFQAVVPQIYVPWYCFTPNNCSSTSSSNYIFVNSITAEVRLFPTNAEYKPAQ
jgi:hypothetical protein